MVTGEPVGLTADLPLLLAAADVDVLVVGDAILDEWLSGRSTRLCREAPAPVVEVDQRTAAAGGAANTAANLAALGARVRLATVVGDDADGRVLTDAVAAAGVDVSAVVVEAGRRTVAKRRIVAGDHLIARVDEGTVAPCGPVAAARLADLVRALAPRCGAVLVADYGLGVATGAVAEALAEVRPGVPVCVVDAHDLARWEHLRPDVVTPNAEEAGALLGRAWPVEGRPESVEEAAGALADASGAGRVVVTLDRDGSVLLPGAGRGGRPYRTWAVPAPSGNTAGAGDSYVGALTLALAAGLPPETAVEFAQAAADVVVSRRGTSVCTAADLAVRLARHRGAALDHDALAAEVGRHRAAGRRVVFTNGCFDVLHSGHVAYLEQAKRLGDVLVVAVNSDDGVRRRRGGDRPVHAVADRVSVLSALSCVDHVTVFDDDAASALVARLRPDVYAKGGDYTAAMLPEAGAVLGYGGRIEILDYVTRAGVPTPGAAGPAWLGAAR